MRVSRSFIKIHNLAVVQVRRIGGKVHASNDLFIGASASKGLAILNVYARRNLYPHHSRRRRGRKHHQEKKDRYEPRWYTHGLPPEVLQFIRSLMIAVLQISLPQAHAMTDLTGCSKTEEGTSNEEDSHRRICWILVLHRREGPAA